MWGRCLHFHSWSRKEESASAFSPSPSSPPSDRVPWPSKEQKSGLNLKKHLSPLLHVHIKSSVSLWSPLIPAGFLTNLHMTNKKLLFNVMWAESAAWVWQKHSTLPSYCISLNPGNTFRSIRPVMTVQSLSGGLSFLILNNLIIFQSEIWSQWLFFHVIWIIF